MDYMNRAMAKRVVFISFFITLAITHSVSYGFDSGAACSEKTARRGKAVLIKSIPCDLSTQAYCDLPGTLYPWNAVRRFVNENQGMMKRMYGDVRHISVLRNEINNNDITLDDIEEATARYSRAGWKRNKYTYQQSTKTNKNADLKIVPLYRRASQTNRSNDRSTKPRSTNAPPTDTLSVEQSVPLANAKEIKRLKPNEKREKMTTLTVDKTDTLESKADDSSSYEEIIEAAIEEIFENSNVNSTMNDNSTSSIKPTKLIESTTETYLNSTSTNNPVMPIRVNKSEPSPTISTTLRIHSLTKEDKNTTPAPSQSVADENSNIYTTESIPISNSTRLNSTYSTVGITEINANDALNVDKDEMSVAGTQIDNNRVSADADDDEEDDDGNIGSDDHFNHSSKPDSEHSSDKKPLEENSVGQLYQDVAEKEDPVVVDARGVNACPVKEEVVAPFWANNTRGEVLALLNLYPFEQYVHWEKCTQEHKQMYCRDGCRCEQQYRLHRLLAYDPHNECRGIFSDWFRFPSCCICKCYNIPIEYRVTSRSPRSLDKLLRDESSGTFAGNNHADFSGNFYDDDGYP